MNLKKIISMGLAMSMVTAIPAPFYGFADPVDYQQGTEVIYVNPNAQEEYTITVPARLKPGTAGNVTLSGLWASDRVVSVKADKTVTLVNSINSKDTKVLDVTFAGIAESGSNTGPQTFVKPVSVENIEKALFGTWEGIFNYNVDSDDLESPDALQNMYEFQYYGSVSQAVADINSGAVGENSAAKEGAPVGVYVNEGKTYVVLLNDVEETEIIAPAVDMTINLGGRKLTSTAPIAINVTAACEVAIDARLSGSGIHVKETAGTATILQGVAGSTIAVQSGTYIAEGADTAYSAIKTAGRLEISDAEISCSSVAGALIGIELPSGATGSIVNTNILAVSETSSAITIKNTGNDVSIDNCNITAESSLNAAAIRNDKNLTVANSKLSATAADSGNAYTILNNKAAANLVLENSKIIVDSYGNGQALKSKGTVNASGCEFEAYSETGTVQAIWNDGGTLTMSNSEATAISDAVEGDCVGLQNTGTATLTKCDLVGLSDYTYAEGEDGNHYAMMSYGAFNTNNLTLNDCYVMGTHSGMQNEGTLNINGGTFEGYGHGGIYFAGTNNVSYVKDAVLRECEVPDEYEVTSSGNGAALYIGGKEGNDNIVVYMDDCEIRANSYPIVLRGSAGEQNNTLYISNSTINKNYNQTGVRIDNDTHRLVIGQGCNFNANNTNRPGVVTSTDEVYAQ